MFSFEIHFWMFHLHHVGACEAHSAWNNTFVHRDLDKRAKFGAKILMHFRDRDFCVEVVYFETPFIVLYSQWISSVRKSQLTQGTLQIVIARAWCFQIACFVDHPSLEMGCSRLPCKSRFKWQLSQSLFTAYTLD